MRLGMAQRLRIAYRADMVSDLEEKMYVFTYMHTSQIYIPHPKPALYMFI